jgi:hypothetical protein
MPQGRRIRAGHEGGPKKAVQPTRPAELMTIMGRPGFETEQPLDERSREHQTRTGPATSAPVTSEPPRRVDVRERRVAARSGGLDYTCPAHSIKILRFAAR